MDLPLRDPDLGSALRQPEGRLDGIRLVRGFLGSLAGNLAPIFGRGGVKELPLCGKVIRSGEGALRGTEFLAGRLGVLEGIAGSLLRDIGRFRETGSSSPKVERGSVEGDVPDLEGELECPLRFPKDGGLDFRCPTSRLFVEMFGGENETPEISDAEKEFRSVKVVWRGGRQGSEGDEMSDRCSASSGDEVGDPPFEELDLEL